MKRLIALTLCLAMLACLCACGAKNNNATATDATATDAAKNGGVDAVDSLTYSVEQAENAVVVYFSHNDVIREAAEFAAEDMARRSASFKGRFWRLRKNARR